MCDRPRPENAPPLESEELERKEATAADSELDLDRYWGCPGCTFLNPPALEACSVCGRANPAGAAGPEVGGSAAVPAAGPEWSCARCTYLNAPGAHHCGVCAGERPRAAIDPNDEDLAG